MEILFAYVTCSKVESKINLDTSVLLRNKKWEGEKEKNVENKYDIYIYEFCEKKKIARVGIYPTFIVYVGYFAQEKQFTVDRDILSRYRGRMCYVNAR